MTLCYSIFRYSINFVLDKSQVNPFSLTSVQTGWTAADMHSFVENGPTWTQCTKHLTVVKTASTVLRFLVYDKMQTIHLSIHIKEAGEER